MAIASTDIHFRLSGGAANSLPAASLGGAKSSVDVSGDIFDVVGGAESSAGDVEYRCVYVHNAHATLTLYSAVLWVPANASKPGSVVEVGTGTSAVNGVEQSIANEGAAPSGVTFAPAATQGAGVALGDIPPGQSRAAWFRRSVSVGAPPTAQSDPVAFAIRATGDTAA